MTDRAASGDSGLKVLRLSPGHYGFGHLDNIALQVWPAAADEPAALELVAVADELYRLYPDGISTIHWLRHGSGLPTAAARKHMSATLEKRADWMGEVAIILSGDGFWASAVRGMLTGLRIAAGGRGRLRIAASMQEVADWLPAAHRARTGVAVSSTRLIDAMEELVERSM